MLKFKPLSLLLALNVLSATAEDVIQSPAPSNAIQSPVVQSAPQPITINMAPAAQPAPQPAPQSIVNNYYYAPINQPSAAPAQPVATAPQVAEKSISHSGSHGFFIGGGYYSMKTNLKGETFFSDTPDIIVEEKVDVTNQGGFAQIGFKTKAIPLFISGAISVNFGGKKEIDPDPESDPSTSIYRQHLNPVVDVQLNLGFDISSTLSIYGIIGARGYHLETEQQRFGVKKSKTFSISNGFFGGGVETLLYKNLFIFGEYTAGGKSSKSVEEKRREELTAKYSVEKSQAIKVGARYYFK